MCGNDAVYRHNYHSYLFVCFLWRYHLISISAVISENVSWCDFFSKVFQYGPQFDSCAKTAEPIEISLECRLVGWAQGTVF